MIDEAAAIAAEEDKPIEIDLEDFDAADEAEMTVTKDGKLTTWVWTFAGPGHPKAVAQSNRLSRERLHEDKEKEQARVNGKKWKASEEAPDEVRKRNVAFIVERLLRWNTIKLNGEVLPFSAEAATRVLSDPRKISLLIQALEFLNEDKSFIKRAATN
jgi:hypothetical protein